MRLDWPLAHSLTVSPPFRSGEGEAILNSFATWPMKTTVYVVLTSNDPLLYSYEFYSVHSTRKDAEEVAEALRELGAYGDATVTDSILH